MNCLLLLFILFCCGNGQNGSCQHSNCQNGCGHVNSCGCGSGTSSIGGNSSGCGVSNGCRPTPPPPPMPRTQFPYLDKEPCTCGCEENK